MIDCMTVTVPSAFTKRTLVGGAPKRYRLVYKAHENQLSYKFRSHTMGYKLAESEARAIYIPTGDSW